MFPKMPKTHVKSRVPIKDIFNQILSGVKNMECNINYVGKWDKEDVYYCINHHKKASINGKKLNECICNKKEYEKCLTINKEDIYSIKFTYPNLLTNLESTLKVNDKEVNILYIGKSMLEKRDFGGLLLSKLNNINLEVEVCPYCNNIHSDDGKFAYKPHNPHLCAYCGRLFHVDHPNIGNEIASIFNIPDLNLDNKCLEIKSELKIEYDILTNNLLVNNICCNKIKVNNQEYYLKDYLNEKLYNEF